MAVEPDIAMTDLSAAKSKPTPASLSRYGSSFLLDAVNASQQEARARAEPRDELKAYLSTPLEKTDNILHYWGVSDVFVVLFRC